MYLPVPDDDTTQDETADVEAENRVDARKVKAQADADRTAASSASATTWWIEQ